MEIFVNGVWMDLRDNARYRILWISPDGGPCWWIALDGKRQVPEKVSMEDLLAWRGTGRLVKAEDPVPATRKPTAAQREIRDRRFSVISDAVSREPEIYDPHKRARILAEISSREGVRVQNLYRSLGRYWKGGKKADAFLALENRRGKCRDYTKGTYRPLGRRRREGAPGKVLTQEDFRNFSQAVQKYYLSEDKLSLTETYSRMLKERYCNFDTGEDGARRASMRPPGELPSFMQFRYWYRNNRDVVAEVKTRDGEGAFERNARSIVGHTERKYTYPGAAFQIDATIADIYLVKENDRNAIVGRPVMYFVMDAYTRMVTGMLVTFRPPSWADAMAALDNTLSDKVEYCMRFGIGIQDEEWPCRQLPSAIIADRGEMEGRAADVLVSGLGIRIENTPPYRGDLKGIIEQHFRLINLQTSDLLPGKVRKDFGQRGTRDYRLDARLDIRQFTRIIIKCVLFHNNFHLMEGYQKEPQMRSMGIPPVPRDLWRFGVRYRSGGLVSLPREQVRYTLLPKEEGAVTERGVAFHGMHYVCGEAYGERWFEKARIAGRTKTDIAYDPTSTAAVYILHEDGRFLKCLREDLKGPGSDTTFAEVDDDQERDLDERAAHNHEEMERKAELLDFIDREIEKAVRLAEGQKDPALPKTRRLGEIGRNRKTEIEGEGGLDGTMDKAGPETGVVQPPPKGRGPELNAVEKMIRRQLEERLKGMEEARDGNSSKNGGVQGTIPG